MLLSSLNENGFFPELYNSKSGFHILFEFISRNYTPEKLGFLDYGSGMGRVLYFAHKYNFKKYVGIEFAEEFCKKSNHFFKTQGINDINIINIDASKYLVDDDINIFYL